MPMKDPTDRHFYISKSLDAALTAVNYGPDLSETHMILGDVLKTITLNPNLSIKELNKSIRLNPNNAEAYVYMAYALMELGRFSEAEKNLLKAKQLDPLSMLMKFAWLLYYYYSRNAEKYIQYLDELGSLNKISIDSGRKAMYYFLKDRYDSLLIYGNRSYQATETSIALIKTGKINLVNMIIDSLRNASENDNAFRLGIIYGWMGKKEKAIEYLNRAYLLNDYALISIKVNKLFDPLRNENGFKNLLLKMGVE
jgi:adenylate cyclase